MLQPGNSDAGCLPDSLAGAQVAAFLLDHGHFAGVPPTALASCRQDLSTWETKVGSLQGFVPSDGDCEERGPSPFPVHEVKTKRRGWWLLCGQRWLSSPSQPGACLGLAFLPCCVVSKHVLQEPVVRAGPTLLLAATARSRGS